MSDPREVEHCFDCAYVSRCSPDAPCNRCRWGSGPADGPLQWREVMHTLTFQNEDGHRESLGVCGPRCVAEWHAAKLRRQRVTRFVQITPNKQPFPRSEARDE